MVSPINKSSYSSAPSLFETIKQSASSVFSLPDEKDMITQIESAKDPKQIRRQKELQLQTDVQAKAFIKKASLFTRANLIYKFCLIGPKDSSEDENKLKLAVKDLSKYNNPGWYRTHSVMKSYFSNISFIKYLFLYIAFIGWLPDLYIQKSTEKIIKFFRGHIKKGENLPVLGSNLLGTANVYLANHNRTIQRFRDDPNNPIGDRDSYIRQELKRKEILGCENTEKLYKDFANSASREDIRPAFRALSKPFLKFQTLDFGIFKKPEDQELNTIIKTIKAVIVPFTWLAGLPFFIAARFIEWFPNRIIKIVHKNLIASFMPSVISNTVNSVNSSGFSHAINSFLCDLIQDFLNDMKKKPEDRDISEYPNLVNDSLSQDIRKFSELLFTVLQREPYKSQEELEYLKKNGPDSKSATETFLKLITKKHYLDRRWIQPTFIDAFHAMISNGFNVLFARPEKAEEYLNNALLGLNKVFDSVPDPSTEEGKALIEEQREKQRRRDQLINELLEKSLRQASTDSINNITSNLSFNIINPLSKNQRESIAIAVRKIKKMTSDQLYPILSDIKDILANTKKYPSDTQSDLAKKDIEKALVDINRLHIAISNLMPADAGPEKEQMKKILKNFFHKEQSITDNIVQIKNLHEHVTNLKKVEKELREMNKSLESKNLLKIKQHLDELKTINNSKRFDKILDNFLGIFNHLEKILRHQKLGHILSKFSPTSIFANNPIYDLMKAQKALLADPRSIRKEHSLMNARKAVQKILKELEEEGYEDFDEVNDLIRKIINSNVTSETEESYQKAQEIFRKKLLAQNSLNKDEQRILPSHYENCKAIIAKELAEFSMHYEDAYTKTIKSAEDIQKTVNQLKESLSNLGKSKFAIIHEMPISLMTTIAAAGAYSKGYYPGVSLAIGALANVPRALRFATSNLSVPLAKTTVVSAYNVATNQAFYEGLIHSYMKQFSDYIKVLKG
ncbi:MAG: hypothetical protein JXA94_03150 [Parachlamydiales bacterium]|nr:hypothetical protein [Parachlamydiales bacterium]